MEGAAGIRGKTGASFPSSTSMHLLMYPRGPSLPWSPPAVAAQLWLGQRTAALRALSWWLQSSPITPTEVRLCSILRGKGSPEGT